ncbi:universal stress A-like protein, partial [Trifolium pratense]
MASGRRLGVAVDFSPCSVKALQWTVDNLVREGDNIILVIVSPEEYEHGEMQLWSVTGSPLIPLAEFNDSTLSKKYEIKPSPEVIKIATTAVEQKK